MCQLRAMRHSAEFFVNIFYHESELFRTARSRLHAMPHSAELRLRAMGHSAESTHIREYLREIETK
jgi:hypothetical protein